MQKLNIKADKFLAYISLLLTILILSSITFNVFYYQQYNIEITDYMDLSESISMFIPYLKQILFNALPLAIGSFIGIKIASSFSGYLWRRRHKDPEETKPVEGWDDIIVGGIGCFVAAAISHRFLYGDHTFFSPGVFLVSISVFGVSVLQKFKGSAPIRFIFPEMTLVFTVYLFYFFIQSLNGDSFNADRNKMYRYFISLKDSNKTIQTDSIISIIGKTKDFIFVFNAKTRVTSVIPNEEIKQIDISLK